MSRANGSISAALALQPHCSLASAAPVDSVLARGPRTAIGQFRCPVNHPSFRDTGPISECIVVFPRTNVWIRHEGSKPFLADATVATIYNRGQRYERFPIAHDGDRCDWFGVDDDLAREIAGSVDPAQRDARRPFRIEWAVTSAHLYYRQRALVRRAKRGTLDLLAMEEGVMSIVAMVLASAHRQPLVSMKRQRSARERRRELADAARTELASRPHANESVHALARRLGTSPFHLCRVFREFTGQTMHEYRTQLRLRLSLERLEVDGSGASSLSAVACDLGFASHSHYVRNTRQHFGATPSVIRQILK